MRAKHMTAEQHIEQAQKLQSRARLHGGLFGRGTRKRKLQEASLHLQQAQLKR
jgi:hypothetical protein